LLQLVNVVEVVTLYC
jgi:hypothetical protein